jgi:nicotinamidase/pyrazinamidase
MCFIRTLVNSLVNFLLLLPLPFFTRCRISLARVLPPLISAASVPSVQGNQHSKSQSFNSPRMSSLPPSPCLIIVDVQNDYVLTTGALPCPDAETIIPCIHNAAHSGHFTSGVYLSADDKPPTSESDGTRQSSRWPQHCISGTFGARLHDGLQHELLRDAVVVTKSSSMSAFGNQAKGETTQLCGLLQSRAPSHVVVCGLALEYALIKH